MDLRELRAEGGSRHPWEQARARLVGRLVEPTSAPLRVIDAGAGDAYLAGELARQLPAGSRVTCWDAWYSESEIASLSSTAQPGFRFTAEAPTDQFDLALALDVIEHVADDRAFLRELHSMLAPGGALVVTVPAWPWLFSNHDVALGHHRRYTPSMLRSSLVDSGFRVQRSGALFASLLPIRVLQRLRNGAVEPSADGDDVAPQSDLVGWDHHPAFTALVRGVLELDGRTAIALATLGVRLPGLSCWAICTRP